MCCLVGYGQSKYKCMSEYHGFIAVIPHAVFYALLDPTKPLLRFIEKCLMTNRQTPQHVPVAL